jgi:hypothetical protein
MNIGDGGSSAALCHKVPALVRNLCLQQFITTLRMTGWREKFMIHREIEVNMIDHLVSKVAQLIGKFQKIFAATRIEKGIPWFDFLKS